MNGSGNVLGICFFRFVFLYLLFCPFSLLFATFRSWKLPFQLSLQHLELEPFIFHRFCICFGGICNILELAAAVPRYLQHFSLRTSHFQWNLKHFGARTVHVTWQVATQGWFQGQFGGAVCFVVCLRIGFRVRVYYRFFKGVFRIFQGLIQGSFIGLS